MVPVFGTRAGMAFGLAILILGAFGPAVAAQDAASFALVGIDPAGDAINDVAAGTDVDAAVTHDRTDIISLEAALEADNLLLKLGLTTLPAGTSGYMYTIFFDVGDTTYFVCYATQWIGGQVSVENVKSCSRFTEGTQVGAEIVGGDDPVSSGEPGVILEGDGPGYITWPVPLAAIGAVAGDTLTNVYAETWFRGVSTCCAGSTVDSQYYWNSADRAPDADAWEATLGATGPIPLPSLALSEIDAPTIVTAGTSVTVNATLTALGPVPEGNHSLTSTLGNTSWTNTISTEPVAFDANTSSLAIRMTIVLPGDAEPGDVVTQWMVCFADMPEAAEAGETLPACGEATLNFSVFQPAPPAAEPEAVAAPSSSNQTASDDAPVEDESLPGPAGILVTGTLVGLAAAARRRS